MENSRMRQGIAEIAEQAYARRLGIEEDLQHRWWHIRTRILVMTIICVIIGALILYWFVSSILESHRNNRDENLDKPKSLKPSHLERLSNNVLPLEYTLKIIPVLEEGNFMAIGDVEIQLYCKIPVKHIRLHVHGLRIQEITLKEFHAFNESKVISKYILTGEDFIDIFLMQLLITGEAYLLRIKYLFQTNEEPKGLFRSKYIDEERNETRWIALSNFSPDHARSAFPCFDEPWIKTPFRVSIGRRAEMKSHSNSMRKFTENIPNMYGYVWDHYEKTLSMPTHLVGLMVTDFASYKVNVIDRPFHTIFARKEVLKNTGYIAYLIPKIVRLLENLTEFFYEPDKLDIIVLPNLPYSAMENCGIIIFREDYGVIRNRSSTIDHKKTLATVAAHEVAHQWFGNLVTPKWWSDVWLKEGFSSFFGNMALNIINPNWTLENMYTVEFYNILESSGTKFAYPLHIDLNRIQRLSDIFDETSYVKGNCMVYMTFHFLGKKTFLSSVRRYMKMYHYRSTDQENVWNAFQEEIDLQKLLPRELTMKDVMRTWTDQAGFPMLKVKRNQATGAVLLTQHRFYNFGFNKTSKELWHIPLTWTTENQQWFNDTSTKAWMTGKHMTINDFALSQAFINNKWILLNLNSTGLYRVNYNIENWKLLTNSYKALPLLTKVQLLSDSSAFAKAGLLDQHVLWNILQNLEMEYDETLWSIAIDTLKFIKHRLWDSAAFRFLMCKLTSTVYTMEASPLVYSDIQHWTDFKIKLMEWTCSMGHKTCLIMVEELAQKILQNSTFDSIPEKYRMSIYCTYVKVVTGEQWLSLLERYENSEAFDKNSLAYALGCHSNVTLLRRYLSLTSENKTEETYKRLAFVSLTNNPYGLNISTDIFPRYLSKISGEELSKSHCYGNDTLISVLQAFSIYMDREENMKWLKQLKELNEFYGTIIDEVADKVEGNIIWNRKHKSETLRVLHNIIENHTSTQDCTMTSADNYFY